MYCDILSVAIFFHSHCDPHCTIVISLPEYWVTFASVKAPPVKMNESSVNWTEQCCQRPGGILVKVGIIALKGVNLRRFVSVLD